MSQKNFNMFAGVLFLWIALIHGARLLIGWEAALGGVALPVWVSWVALVVGLIMAYYGLLVKLRK